MDGTVTVRLDNRRNSRRTISVVPSLKVSFRRHVLVGYCRLNPADGQKFPAAVSIQSCFADDVNRARPMIANGTLRHCLYCLSQPFDANVLEGYVARVCLDSDIA